jgi:hypothetical protein
MLWIFDNPSDRCQSVNGAARRIKRPIRYRINRLPTFTRLSRGGGYFGSEAREFEPLHIIFAKGSQGVSILDFALLQFYI